MGLSHTDLNKPVIALDSGKVLIDFDYAILNQKLSRLAGFEIDPEMTSRMEALNSLMQIGELTWGRAVRTMNHFMGVKINEKDWRALYCGVFQQEISGMRETLTFLKKKYRLVVLSNTDQIHWSYLLRHFPIYQLLDGWIVSHEEKMAKPDPGIYRILMERYCEGHVPAFFTDDLSENVVVARELGWRAEIFLNAHQFQEQIQNIR